MTDLYIVKLLLVIEFMYFDISYIYHKVKEIIDESVDSKWIYDTKIYVFL